MLATSLKQLIVINKYISHWPPLLTILAVKVFVVGFMVFLTRFSALCLLVWSLASPALQGSGSRMVLFTVCAWCQAQGRKKELDTVLLKDLVNGQKENRRIMH